jgi:hypothetical protein
VLLISDVAVGDEGPRLRDPALGLSAFRSSALYLWGFAGKTQRQDYGSASLSRPFNANLMSTQSEACGTMKVLREG